MRSLCVAVIGVGLLAGTSCVPWPERPPPGATPTDLDFESIRQTARLALDLTDHNLGLISEWFLSVRNDGEAKPLLLRDVAATSYVIQFDEEAGRQIVALPGTSNANNNEFNLRNELVFEERAGGHVHAGYRDLALQIRDQLILDLRPDLPVTLVGFSQGGAVAALLPLWLLQDGFQIETVITLGQPKVADAQAAGRLALLPVLRLIAADDVIPGYPKVEGYSHFGRSIELLDGPYIVSLFPGDPGYDDPRDLPSDLPDMLLLDHGTYDLRLQSKRGVTVYELPLDEAGDLRP